MTQPINDGFSAEQIDGSERLIVEYLARAMTSLSLARGLANAITGSLQPEGVDLLNDITLKFATGLDKLATIQEQYHANKSNVV